MDFFHLFLRTPAKVVVVLLAPFYQWEADLLEGVKHLIQADIHSVVLWFPNFIMEDDLENLLRHRIYVSTPRVDDLEDLECGV